MYLINKQLFYAVLLLFCINCIQSSSEELKSWFKYVYIPAAGAVYIAKTCNFGRASIVPLVKSLQFLMTKRIVPNNYFEAFLTPLWIIDGPLFYYKDRLYNKYNASKECVIKYSNWLSIDDILPKR